MKARTIAAHVCVPVIFSATVFLCFSWGELPSFGESVMLLGTGSIFYSAPHLLWWIIISTGKLSKPVAHAGFCGASIALGWMATGWHIPKDPSGLPYHWVLYWPLAVVLVLLSAGIVALLHRMFPAESGKLDSP